MDRYLLLGIDIVLRELNSISPTALNKITEAGQLVQIGNLSDFDIDVLRLTAQGIPVKQIAAQLVTSKNSVYRSRKKLREALDIMANEQLVDAARRAGLLEEE